MNNVRHKIKELSMKLSQMSNVAKHATSEQVSHYQMGIYDGRADGLMQAATLLMDLALEIQEEETRN